MSKKVGVSRSKRGVGVILRGSRLGPGTLAILVVTAFVVGLNLWAAGGEFVPHAFYGMLFSNHTGRVTQVYASQAAAASGITRGDHLLDLPDGDIRRGYQLVRPQTGDRIRVATRHGTVTVKAAPARIATLTALAAFGVEISNVIMIALATLLWLRRPGMMSFAFWLWATTSSMIQIDLLPSLGRFPPALAIAVWLAFSGWNIAAVPLIPFALRFPDGRLSPNARWADGFAWCLVIGGYAAYAAADAFHMAGSWGDDVTLNVVSNVASIALPIAGGVLIWRYVRSSAVERAQTAWAIAGFIASILAQAGSDVFESVEAGTAVFGLHLAWYVFARALHIVGNLLPLLAIYPILRYRLFDLGFALNRAALYSTLTVAAVATLAGVNWLAQHLVTERLALVVQPVAAIVIGLGYLRVRAWTQAFLERLLFHERFAAEAHLESTIRGLAAVERPESVDEVLVADAPTTLALSSAALFRLAGDAFIRVAGTGWNDADLQALRSDDPLARRLIADGPLVRLSSAHWHPDGLPASPAEPMIALGLFRRGTLAGIVLYSRHQNGTEIDPEELRLLRRLAEAAAIAYETAEAVTVRAQLARTEAQLAELKLELRYARSESNPA